MCGKQNAKRYMITKEPKEIKEIYELANKLDIFTRYQKNNETNGIVVGPFTSRIFSEIIMAKLDQKLMKKGFKFKRYVDDYKFYFRTEALAQESVSIIEKVLNEYNLNLNLAKTEIEKYPFEIISHMKASFDDAFKREGVFGVLNNAGQFHLNGEKGAYKYALKMLRGKGIPIDDFDIIMPTLINIMLLDPKYGKYVIEYLKNTIDNLNLEEMGSIMNRELRSSLINELQQESLLFMQMIKELKITLTGENLLGILKTGDDFSIIIALDIWKNRNKSVHRTTSEARSINEEIKKLSVSLIGEQYSGSRWLLLYEIEIHKLISKDLIPLVEKNDFFKKLIEYKVSFYNSIK